MPFTQHKTFDDHAINEVDIMRVMTIYSYQAESSYLIQLNSRLTQFFLILSVYVDD